MKVVTNDLVVAYDVDDTLILWDHPNPDSDFNGYPVKVHEKHIQEIKKSKARGHFVIVWSKGGYNLAQQVVDFLDLNKYVDLVIAKPSWCFDDKPLNELAYRCFREEG